MPDGDKIPTAQRPLVRLDQRTSQKPSLVSDLTWEPKAIEPPSVDPELPILSPIQRSAEVLRYNFRKLEYWISPSGVIREWFRFVFKIFVVLAIPVLLLCPVITIALLQLETWTAALLAIAFNLLKAVLCLGALLVIITVGFRQLGRRR